MSLNRVLVLLALTAACWTVAGADARARNARSRSDLNYGPRVFRYDLKKDELIRQESIATRAHTSRPGGALSYTGTRLNQYQFHGKPGRGGIYDALQEYHRELKLDPKKYQYRRHREN